MSWKHHRFGVVGIGAVVLLSGLAGFAAAVLPPGDQHQSYEIPLTKINGYGPSSPVAEVGRARVESAAASAFGGDWRVYAWNPATNAARYMYGSGVQVASDLSGEASARSAAEAVIAAHPDLFNGASLSDLRFEASPAAAGKRSVHFEQMYRGVEVWGGRVHLTFTESGRLFVLGSDYYPNIDIQTTPSIPASVAKDIAVMDLPYNPAADSVEEEARLLVLPTPVTEVEMGYRLVWRVRVHTEDPIGIWVTHVDATTGEIVWRYNDVHFVDVQGTAEGDAQRPSYCEGQQHETFPYLRVTVQGLGSTYADGNGVWSVPYAGNDPQNVTADLYSPYVDLNNVAGAEATFNGVATPGVPLAVNFTDANSQKDEKDVYAAINDVHDFFQAFDPSFPYANQRITANVRVSGTCNAFWNGTINFYGAGGGCANTGEIMGVVYHEFGHGVQASILGSQGNEGLGEGNSDILANLLTRESIIGRGFYLNNCVSGIRNSLNNLQYPEDLNGSVHHDGQIIAGFNWDAMQILRQVHGDQAGIEIAAANWHFGRVLEHPFFQGDQVLATFIADDDDGDLTNGTPNYDAYSIAAENHGYEYPEVLIGVIIQHTPLSTRTEEGDADVVATIYSTEAELESDSLRLVYRLDGGAFVSVQLQPTGNTDEFAATIPNLTVPSEVEYYLRGRDTVGNTRTAPALAPSSLYAFDVANVFDTMEVASGWTVNLESGDDATTGVWERVDPNGTSAQPEDDYTVDPGVICWVTGNAPPGSGDGQNDVDNGTTTLYSPVYNVGAASSAKARFFRWYSNDRGGAPGQDSWIVQVRNNGGSWVDVENTIASSNAWVPVEFDLAAAFGGDLGDVQFKFIASDLGQGSLVEAAVDDFTILAQFSTDAPEVAVETPRFALLGSRPNPVRNGTAIRFQVPTAARVELALYDVAGRLVRKLTDGQVAAGVHDVQWDGRDAEGHEAASGVYFYRFQAEGYSATRTLVVTR